MSQPTGKSRGSELLVSWRGKTPQAKAAIQLETDPATYNRLERGIRKPTAELGFQIERITKGRVPFRAWFQEPRTRAAKAA